MNLWRTICIYLDTIVYSFVETLLQTIMDLANVEIFTKSVIEEFSSRIYIILGLVMLFKLMISFIQVLINPDKMNDKENGVGGILKRTVISLALIFLVPSIFDLSRQVQNYVVPVIPKVVLGVTVDQNTEEENQNVGYDDANVGRTMAWYSFLPFFNYNNSACDHGQIMGTGTNLSNNSTGIAEIYSVYTAAEKVNDKCPESTDSKGYCYQYRWLISTVVGVYLIYVLVTIAVHIAIRTIKLGVCEFIAPIPIASYIDPKTSKQAFDNWVKTSVQTYLDLFIELIVVYFVIFVFSTVFQPENIKLIYERLGGDFSRGALVTLFIIIGLLQFTKKAPKFISDMLGIKGGGSIGEIFNGKGLKGIGTSLGGLAGMLANPVSSGLSNYNYSRKVKGESVGTALRRALAGGVAGGVRATSAAFSGKGWKGAYTDAKQVTKERSMRRVNTQYLRKQDRERYKEEYSNIGQIGAKQQQVKNYREALSQAIRSGDRQQIKTATENLRNAERDLKYEKYLNRDKIRGLNAPAGSFDARVSDAWNEFSGTPNPTSKTYSSAADLMDKGKSIFNAAKTKVLDKPTLVTEDIHFKGINQTGKFSDIYTAYQDYKAGRQVTGMFAGVDGAALETMYGDALKDAASHYVNHVYNGNIDNVAMKNEIVQWSMKFNNETIISAADRNSVQNSIGFPGAENYGNFFKGADNVGAEYRTKAMSLQTTEAAKKGE